jgi:hypothetical protein
MRKLAKRCAHNAKHDVMKHRSSLECMSEEERQRQSVSKCDSAAELNPVGATVASAVVASENSEPAS